jgi:hypothetical protein
MNTQTLPASYKYLPEEYKKKHYPEAWLQEKLPSSFKYLPAEAQQNYINNLMGITNEQQLVEQVDNRPKNTGGFFEGLGYTLGSFGLGALRTLEGVYDFVGSALFSMVGQNEAAKKHFMENRWSYDLGQRLNTWYNPSKGMQFVGDVAGGIGNSAVGMAVGALTGGVGLGLTVGMGAAGGALEDAYHKTGELGFKEFGYATSVGVAEGAMESVFGAGGKVLKSLGVKSFTKQGAKQIVRQGVLRGIWDGAKGEFFEEAAQEVLDPIFQKVWGIDKDAKVEWGVKELFKEGKLEAGSVLYSGLVGAVSGGIIGGVGGTANRVRNTKAGRTIIEANKQNSVIGMNAEFAKVAETQVDKSGIWGEIIELRDAYNKKVAKGENASAQMLGQMQRSAFAASFEPGIQQAKAYLKENWTNFVEDAAKKGYKFNGETITENMVNNEHVVTTLATQSVMGQLFMEPDTFIQQVFNKGAIDLNSFVKFKTEATPEQVYAINKALNVDILADNFNFNDFQKAFDNASKNNPNLSSDLEATFKYLYQVEDAISKQMDSDTKAPVYDISNPNLKEGINIFRANKKSNALLGVVYDQKSDTYRIVEGQDISKPLSLEELNNTFKKLSQPIETATAQQTTTDMQKTVEKPNEQGYNKNGERKSRVLKNSQERQQAILQEQELIKQMSEETIAKNEIVGKRWLNKHKEQIQRLKNTVENGEVAKNINKYNKETAPKYAKDNGTNDLSGLEFPYTIEDIANLPEVLEARDLMDSIPQTIEKIKGEIVDNRNTPERHAVRERIGDHLLNTIGSYEQATKSWTGEVKQERKALIAIGLPASGKSSTMVEPWSERFKARPVDNDMAKPFFGEFNEGWGANAVHEESSYIIEQLVQNQAIERGDNLAFAMVGPKVPKIRALIETLLNAGYQVELQLNELNHNKTAGRAYTRWGETGRYINFEYIAGLIENDVAKPIKTYETLIKELGGKLYGYARISNDVVFRTKAIVQERNGRCWIQGDTDSRNSFSTTRGTSESQENIQRKGTKGNEHDFGDVSERLVLEPQNLGGKSDEETKGTRPDKYKRVSNDVLRGQSPIVRESSEGNGIQRRGDKENSGSEIRGRNVERSQASEESRQRKNNDNSLVDKRLTETETKTEKKAEPKTVDQTIIAEADEWYSGYQWLCVFEQGYNKYKNIYGEKFKEYLRSFKNPPHVIVEANKKFQNEYNQTVYSNNYSFTEMMRKGYSEIVAEMEAKYDTKIPETDKWIYYNLMYDNFYGDNKYGKRINLDSTTRHSLGKETAIKPNKTQEKVPTNRIERIEYYNKKAHEHIQNAYKNVKLFPDMEISKLARQATPVFNNLNKARQDSIKLLVHQAQQSGVDTDTIKQLVKLAAKTNYNIFITDSATSEYTNFYGQNVIYLSKGAITENGAIAKVAMHEIIHALKGVEGYQAMQDFALENMSEERKTKLEEEYRAYYEQQGLEFTEDVLNDEITATYITETLARGSIDKILNTFGRYGETGFKTMLAKFKDFRTMKERSPQISFIERKVRKAFDNYMQGKMAKDSKSKVGDNVRYKVDKPFSEQVDDVIAGKHDRLYDLYVRETPQSFVEKGFEKGPLLMRNSKVKEILSKHQDITAEIIKAIPQSLENPLFILKSRSNPDTSAVAITDITTSKGNVIVPVWINQEGNYYSVEIDSNVALKTNFIASVYSRNVKGLLEYAFKNNEVIRYSTDTKKVNTFLTTQGLQLPPRLQTVNFNSNISQETKPVNDTRCSLPSDPTIAIEQAAQTNDTSAGDMPINAVDLESIPGNQLVYAVPQNLDQWSNLWLKKVPPKEFFEHKKTTFKANLEAVTIQLVNKYEAIERVLRNAGMDRQTAASLTHQASTARSAAMTMLGVAQFDAQYNRVGDSLYDIFKPIHQNNINSEAKSYKKNLENGKYKNKEKYVDYNKKFDLYMLHLHNEARLGQDKSIFGEDVTVEVSKKTIADMEATYPEFKELAKKVRKYSDNLLTYRVQTGLITAEFANHLREMYPYYVPTYRAKDSGPSIRPAYGNIRGVDLNQTVKRAKGSDQAIMPIYDSLAAQTIQVINTGRANNILTHLYYASLQGDKSIDIIGKETVGIEEALSHEIKVEKDTTDKVNNKVSFYFQGEKVTMLVDKNIFTGIESMLGTNKDSGNKLYQTAVKLNSTFKNLVTSWNPFFSIWRNPIKDFGNFVINTKYGVANSMRNYKRAWQEIKNGGYYWQEAQAAGIVGSGIYNYQTKTLKRGETVQDRTIGKLAAVSEMIEMTPRLAEYISAREAGHSVEVALYQAADVTTNFGRSGTLVAKLNATVMPFLNPAVQGANKIWRALVYGDAGKGKTAKGRRLNLLVRLAVFAVATTAFNGFMNDDDEDYKNLSDYTKQANFVIPMGDGKFLKIPKDRLQAVVSSVYLRAKASAEGDEHAWKGMGGFVVGQVTPIDNFSRPLWEPIKDVKTNTTWYGGEIESQRWENVRPSQRYDTRTSEISKSLGKTFNYSPLKIDYLLDQYLGVVGDLVLPASAVAGERSMFERQMLANSTISNKWAGKLSDMSKEYTYRKNEGDVKAELALKYINKIKQDISDLYNKQNEIHADKSLSKDEKVTQSDIIQVAINALRQRAFEGGEEIYNNLKDANIEINDDNKQSIYIDALYGIAGSEYALKTKSKTQYTKAQMYNKLGFNYDMSYQYFHELDQYKKQYAGQLSDRDITVMYTLQLSIPNLEKLILLFSQGYRPKINEQWLVGANKYELEKALAVAISKLKISSEEKIELATMCGYKVEDGKIKLSRTK